MGAAFVEASLAVADWRQMHARLCIAIQLEAITASPTHDAALPVAAVPSRRDYCADYYVVLVCDLEIVPFPVTVTVAVPLAVAGTAAAAGAQPEAGTATTSSTARPARRTSTDSTLAPA